MRRSRKGFSLIPLLILVAIIGMVMAIGKPFYARSHNRSITIISSTVATLQAIMEQAAAKYNKTGIWPTSIMFGETKVSGWTLVNQGNIASMLWTTEGDGKAAGVAATLHNLHGVPNYRSPSTTVAQAGAAHDRNSGANTIYFAMRNVDGTLQSNCGWWQFSLQPEQTPPQSFLPNNCRCSSVESFINNGKSSVGCN